MFLSWLTTVLSSIIIGIILTLSVQLYFYKKYFSEKVCDVEEHRFVNEPLTLPKIFTDLIRNEKISPNDSCMAINLLLQFLFHELRDTEKVRRWFRKKLSLEFEQLLESSAIGRMIAHIKIREIHLGSEFPVICNVGVQSVQTNEGYSHIDVLDLKLDLSYCGNFRLVVDVIMLLGKAACVSITVNELHGIGRLQFSRLPYSHWSFTFYNEPKLQLEVVSQFQGRAYHQITALIANQIRKALRRKHTLPNFKVRYKPFFDAAPCVSKALNILPGEIQLTIHRITRLNDDLANNREIYVLLGTDSLPWVEIRNYGSVNFVVMDVSIVKKSQVVGLYFKQDFVENKDEQCLILDEMKLGGFESEIDLHRGDIATSVDGKRVTSLSQLHKYIRSVPTQFTLRIERRITAGKACDTNSSNIPTVSTVSSCPIYSGLRRRKGSESESCTSTPTASLPGSPARRTYFRGASDSLKASPSHKDTVHQCDELCQKLVKSRSLTNSQVLRFDDVFSFNVSSEEKYLNVNVRARESETQSDMLLGFVNIPLSEVESTGDNLKSFQLKPPDVLASHSRSHKLSCQSGFIPSLCYGDIVVSMQYSHAPHAPSSPVGVAPTIAEVELTKSESAESFQDSVAGDKKHDFVRTHFNASTQCDFCGKKIWFKDAERCRECGMSCHKKCVVRCKSESVCAAPCSAGGRDGEVSGASASPVAPISLTVEDVDASPRRGSTRPEITTTLVEDVAVAAAAAAAVPQSAPKKGLGGLLANVASRSLKRVGSANSLVLPGGQFPSLHSKSLPPSPQQSPAPSRKPSLPTELSDEITSVLDALMQQGSSQGDLMYFAKESGKTLYEELDLSERKEKIHDMINKLKSAINAEVDLGFALQKEEQSTKDPTAKAKAAFLIGKNHEKTQALTMLMLHFCAGLQHIQDLEEQEKEIEFSNASSAI